MQAKVRRFIASEYGLNTRNIDRAGKLGRALAPKIETVDYLIATAAKHAWFTWSAIGNNIFFDWVRLKKISCTRPPLTTTAPGALCVHKRSK